MDIAAPAPKTFTPKEMWHLRVDLSHALPNIASDMQENNIPWIFNGAARKEANTARLAGFADDVVRVATDLASANAAPETVADVLEGARLIRGATPTHSGVRAAGDAVHELFRSAGRRELSEGGIFWDVRPSGPNG